MLLVEFGLACTTAVLVDSCDCSSFHFFCLLLLLVYVLFHWVLFPTFFFVFGFVVFVVVKLFLQFFVFFSLVGGGVDHSRSMNMNSCSGMLTKYPIDRKNRMRKAGISIPVVSKSP